MGEGKGRGYEVGRRGAVKGVQGGEVSYDSKGSD